MIIYRATTRVRKIVSVLILVLSLITFTPIRAHCLHTSNVTASTVKSDIFLYNNEQMKILMFHNAEGQSDIPVYSQLIDIANKYRGQDVQILIYAVSRYQEDAGTLLTYAPDWDFHHWLSIPEFQKLSKELVATGINIGEAKDLPYLAVITPQGHVLGQWSGIEKFINIDETLKTAGYSPAKKLSDTITTGADFVKKTEPIYRTKISQDGIDSKAIHAHFNDSTLSREFKLIGGETRIRKVHKNSTTEAWLSSDISKSKNKCSNFYILEVINRYDVNKYLYCTHDNEAFLISSHSGNVDKMFSFLGGLYASRKGSLSQQEILSKCEDSSYCSYLAMLFTGMPDQTYDEQHLLEALNGAIKKWDEMKANADLERQKAHELSTKRSAAYLSGKSDQLMCNYKEKKICIPHSTANEPESKKKYLILSYEQEYDLKSLEYSLSNDRHIQIKRLIVDGQEWMQSSQKVGGLFSYYIFFDVPNEYLIFEGDEKGSYSKLLQEVHLNVKFGGVLESEQAEKQNWYNSWKTKVLSSDTERLVKDVIKRKWLEKFGHELYAGLHVVAAFDQQDQISIPSASAASNQPAEGYNPSGVLVEIRPPYDGIKYVKAKFFIRGMKSKRDDRILTASKLNTNRLFYISLPQLYIKKAEAVGDYNCSSSDWESILPKGIDVELY